eukprot:CAMPEP_0182854184 /NCGR_PEP_ID=MMETSP0034_2-20130328/1099_1 /TAXON_ID=156128 /ORGANISM="Nephroselmis pyriformis, Strain CCMP717" /LENGTH=159 /DNA_ID=CAMNT_0024984983 /DNA_START=85 /DNA_END=564 /DNA_ORIENTATION=-
MSALNATHDDRKAAAAIAKTKDHEPEASRILPVRMFPTIPAMTLHALVEARTVPDRSPQLSTIYAWRPEYTSASMPTANVRRATAAAGAEAWVSSSSATAGVPIETAIASLRTLNVRHPRAMRASHTVPPATPTADAASQGSAESAPTARWLVTPRLWM